MKMNFSHIFPARHKMTTLPGSPDGEGVAITTTANTAYAVTKHGERLEDEYELVSSPPESSPGGYVNVVLLPPPPSHQPLPAVPSPVATPTPENGSGEEAVYEPIPG